MQFIKNKVILYLTFSIAIAVIIASCCGLLIDDVYASETANWRAQAIGQDMVNIFIIVPILIASGILAYYGNKISFFIFGGAILFLVYSFAIYCFAIHFNFLFLVYCFTFGLSAYAFLWFVSFASTVRASNWFDNKVPIKLMVIFLICFASIFCVLWISEIAPAMIQKGTPRSIAETGLLTNPIHVLDLSLLLPGMVITAILLLKEKPLGFILTPVLLVFCILMTINIAGLVIIMKQKGLDNSLSVAAIMGGLAIVCAILFNSMVRHLKKAALR